MKSKRLCLLALLLCALHPGLAQKPLTGQTVLHLTTDANNPRNTEGSFVKLRDGRILMVYSRFSGSANDHAPAQLVARYSSDGGVSWSKKDRVIVDREGEMNVMSVSLLRLKDGRIALFYARKNSTDDCIPQMRTSSDEGASWSGPRPVITDQAGYFVLNNDRVIQLGSGRLLVPVSLHKTAATKWSNKGLLRCYFSDDSGTTWQRGEEVPAPDSVITQEPGVVELSNGKTMMVIRASGGRQYRSFSDDGGKTWRDTRPSGLRSPIAPASVKSIPETGHLLAVFNNNGEAGPGYHKSKRSPLTLALSVNDGDSWQVITDIENNPEEEYAYTAILFDGAHVLFSYYVKPDEDPGYALKVKRYRLADLYGARKRLPVLLAANKHSNTLSFVDPVGFDVLETIPVGPNPHEITVTPDQRWAYLSNYAPPGNTISVIDLRHRKHIRQISTGETGRIHGAAVSPDGAYAYFTAGQSGMVIEVATRNHEITRRIPTHGKISHMVYVSPDGKYLLTANITSEDISVIDRVSGKLLRRIPAGKGVEGMAFTPDNRYLWALNQTGGTVTVIDRKTWEPVDTFACPGMPVRIRFTGDGKRALVAGWVKEGTLTVIDVTTRKELKRIPVGDFAIGVEISPDGRYAFVGCEDAIGAENVSGGVERAEAHKKASDGIHVVDLAKLEVIAVIKTGLGPDPMVMWYPDGRSGW